MPVLAEIDFRKMEVVSIGTGVRVGQPKTLANCSVSDVQSLLESIGVKPNPRSSTVLQLGVQLEQAIQSQLNELNSEDSKMATSKKETKATSKKATTKKGTTAKKPVTKKPVIKKAVVPAVALVGSPRKGSKTGNVWALANKMKTKTRKEVLAKCEELGYNKAMSASQYYRWSVAFKAAA